MFLYKIQDLIKIVGKLKSTGLDSLINRLLIISSIPLAERIIALASACQDPGYFLARFKKGRTIVIPKPEKTLKGKKDAKTQRPIALLNTISKLFKNLSADKLLLMVGEHNLLSYPQIRNQKNRSTNIALIIILVDYIYSIWDMGSSAYLYLLNINSAFNTISYTQLLNTLRKKGTP